MDSDYSPRLFTDDFDNHAFAPHAVEFSVIDLLPCAQIKTAIGNRQQDLMMHQQVFQMRVAVVFAGLVVAVIGASRGQAFQPLVNVGNKTIFSVIDVNGSSDVHRRNQHQAFLDAAVGDGLRHFVCNIDVFAFGLCVEDKVLRVRLHLAYLEVILSNV